MSGRADATVPSIRRPRKSTGLSPARKRMEKENITVDVASSLAGNAARKKLRSKSMGPGGLDVLKSGSGNRRVSLAAPAKPTPRSILKPTIPLLPEIPPHKPKSSRNGKQSSNVQGADKLPNPFQNDDSTSSGTKIALRTEEEQHAAARDRDEKERAALEKQIKDHREARRKSLANRRVSFAAEATLHEFYEIEYMQDSTSSTDSTRRASSVAAQSPAPAPAVRDASDPPSTPPEQVEDVVPESPDHQRDLHQKKRRRSSGVPPLNFNNPDDDTLASTVYSSDSEATDGVIETHEEITSASDSDSDADDGTTMDLVVDEMTGTSVASGMSARSFSTEDSNDTLNGALRLAARQAQTQNMDEEEEIIPSFGWGKKSAPKHASPSRDQENLPSASRDRPLIDFEDNDNDDDGMDMDMDMTNAVGSIFKSNAVGDDTQDDMSMDVTKALGGILPQQTNNSRRKSQSPDKFGDGSSMEDETMDLTMAIGGIRQSRQDAEDTLELESNGEDEDMSMEMTTVLGGVVTSSEAKGNKRKPLPSRRRTLKAADDEATMDMTVGLGRILSTDENPDGDDDATMGMDMTVVMGGIIKGPSPVKDRAHAKQIMEEEASKPDDSPLITRSSPFKMPLSTAKSATGTPTKGTPGLSAFSGKELRRSTATGASAASKAVSPSRDSSPLKFSSPMKDVTPNAKGPSTPSRTPQSKKPSSRSASPKRAAPNDVSITPKSTHKSPRKGQSLFQQDPSTGTTTPRVVLTPQNRRLSGVGADRRGLGSPRVAEIMDRRGSIGDVARDFVPGKANRGVSFADPRMLAMELDKDRQAEEDREDGRSILEREADGSNDENSTGTLKDMIASMSPKKNLALKGRKSLHVGSAKGLLGKRVAELDDDDEEDEGEDRGGIKRLKGHQSSPVKNVRLHAPPTKAETTGRATRSTRRSLADTSGNTITPTLSLSPKKGSKLADSPSTKGRFKDVESDQATYTVNFDETTRIADLDMNADDQGDRMHLQDFLNMTNIRFMELTTTKRRHTQAPASFKDNTLSVDDDVSLERCVIAGACTVPMLELYQHSCRELKKYISEGRRIVREMETETLEENPPLFQEYMTATPEFKMLMDNQFKNVKTHARLLSKAMWYEWRMKLQDGLKEGLVKISEGMDADAELLTKEEKLLESVLPSIAKRFEELELEHENLLAAAQELAECDPEDLQGARAELKDVDEDLAAKQCQIEELRQVLQETESTIGDASQRKQECLAAIEDAEKIREECRGWTSHEINSLKAKVDAIERQHGWNITGIQGTTVSMTFRREIELVFDIASFQGAKANSRIDLWYIAANREANPQPATPEREFFLQCIRDHVRSLAQAQTDISTLLRVVSAAWTKADAVANDIRLLNCTFPTQVVKTGDSSIAVKIALFLAPLETKVQLVLGLQGQSTGDGVGVTIAPEANVVYGEHFKVDKVGDYLSTRIGGSVVTKEENAERESWSDVVVELHERLLARGRKQ